MSDELATQLMRDEAVVLHAYEDSEGWLTIGVGRLIDEKKGGCITREEALYLLRNDISKVEMQVAQAFPWSASLSEARLGALHNMTFEMGINGLRDFVHFLNAMQHGNWANARAEMLDSKWATQVGARANRLAKQITDDTWQ